MQIVFLVQAFACLMFFSNTMYTSLASPKDQTESSLNQKTAAEGVQSPKASRQISLSSLLNPDKKNYKTPLIGSLAPKNFQIFINGQEINDNTTKSIPIAGNQLVIRRTYTFEYTFPWVGTKISLSGEREFTFELNPAQEEFTLDYDWHTPQEVEAQDRAKSSPIKTKVQFILSNAMYLKGHLKEDGSEYA